MSLTRKMKDEIVEIQERVLDLFNGLMQINILSPTYIYHNSRVIKNLHREELKTYKIRLENLFSETDDNFDKELILKLLLQVEDLINDTCGRSSDDYGRYTTMGLQIVPNDPFFNLRKKNDIHVKIIRKVDVNYEF